MFFRRSDAKLQKYMVNSQYVVVENQFVIVKNC